MLLFKDSIFFFLDYYVMLDSFKLIMFLVGMGVFVVIVFVSVLIVIGIVICVICYRRLCLRGSDMLEVNEN